MGVLDSIIETLRDTPSWAERAQAQAAKDKEAFLRGGPKAMMQDFIENKDLAGGFNPANIGIAGTFAGVGAKTANLPALKLAQDYLAKGVDPRTVREITGWFAGHDGKFRFEIPDNNMTIGGYESGKPAYGKVSDFVDHPELYEAYPQLRDLDAKIMRMEGSGASGSYSSPNKSVYAAGTSEKGLRSVTAHELQHAVQDIERFDPGYNPKRAAEIMWANRPLNAGGNHMQPYEIYQGNMGEMEARNVQDRLDYTPTQRAVIPPTAQTIPASKALSADYLESLISALTR